MKGVGSTVNSYIVKRVAIRQHPLFATCYTTSCDMHMLSNASYINTGHLVLALSRATGPSVKALEPLITMTPDQDGDVPYGLIKLTDMLDAARRIHNNGTLPTRSDAEIVTLVATLTELLHKGPQVPMSDTTRAPPQLAKKRAPAPAPTSISNVVSAGLVQVEKRVDAQLTQTRDSIGKNAIKLYAGTPQFEQDVAAALAKDKEHMAQELAAERAKMLAETRAQLEKMAADTRAQLAAERTELHAQLVKEIDELRAKRLAEIEKELRAEAEKDAYRRYHLPAAQAVLKELERDINCGSSDDDNDKPNRKKRSRQELVESEKAQLRAAVGPLSFGPAITIAGGGAEIKNTKL